MSTLTVIINLIVFIIIRATNQFAVVMLNFMNKDYEGNLFENYYLEAVAEVLGILLVMPLPKAFGIKWAFFSCYAFGLLATWVYYMGEMNYWTNDWIIYFGYPESPFEPGSDEDLYHYKKITIPLYVFLIKIFAFAPNNIVMNDDLIFPSNGRAIYMGVSVTAASAVACLGPIVASLERPWQAYALFIGLGFSLLVSLFLPSKADEEELIQKTLGQEEKAENG